MVEPSIVAIFGKLCIYGRNLESELLQFSIIFDARCLWPWNFCDVILVVYEYGISMMFDVGCLCNMLDV